ncbi:ComF family protein [Rhodobacter viridis]|uniref:ComF family protein n=1 Tax=Rhodobacter viridis TaxID=1054202 RepID=A0A318U5X8_9RHOB|nr:ComF family protein [Rhodobacter viridis]PYF11786.1 ComF family protein [Rhodobacter viridis]
MPDAVRSALRMALHTVFPPRCICCGAAVSTDYGLCGPCWRETSFISGAVCDCCGLPLPGDEAGTVLCDDCLASPRPWARGRAAFLYAGTGRKLVLQLKHADRLDLVPPLALMLARAAEPILRPKMLVAPVPLHRLRLVRRKFNQSAMLAQGLARERGLACVPDLFVRTRPTAAMEGMTRGERRTNLEGAIAVTPKHLDRIKGKHLLLIDDVLTSGSTLEATAEAALAAGASKVSVAVLARVARDG